jgi:hypothetical protein
MSYEPIEHMVASYVGEWGGNQYETRNTMLQIIEKGQKFQRREVVSKDIVTTLKHNAL